MKTNIKVIGIMAILITILLCSSTSALNVDEFTRTLVFTSETYPNTNYISSGNSTIAFGVESASHDDVCFKVTSDDGKKHLGISM